MFLPGDRMYSAQARKISNAGAPVFSLDGGRVLGAISLSGGSDMMHIHTLGLVRQAAETVTSQLRERERIRELAIKNQYMRALVESDSRGIVTVDQTGRIVEANSTARKLLKLSPGCEGKSFEESVGESYNITGYLKEGKGFRAREILARRSGTTHFASLDPIRMNSGELGRFVHRHGKKEMMRMAVEMTGAHAHFTFESILGASESLRSALHLAHIAAGSTAPVLLSGETGTGKELFAQAIHNDGPRRNRPFVAINCGAIPKELLESELFGYEEGAFTGAQKGGRPGKFELADTGTLFLDEIGDMPFDMQVKLLRVLQSGEIQRVGGLRTVPVDLRIISATNKDLKQAIAQHQFRADLYYRISTLSILVPPLRERAEDILPLAEHFIRRHELRLNRHPVPLPQETAEAIRRYPWPGNIRQLESAVERAVHLAEGGALLPEHFGIADLMENRRPAAPAPAQATLEDRAAGHRRRPRPFWREHQSDGLCPRRQPPHAVPEDEQIRSGRINAGEILEGRGNFSEEREERPPTFPFPKPVGAIPSLSFQGLLYLSNPWSQHSREQCALSRMEHTSLDISARCPLTLQCELFEAPPPRTRIAGSSAGMGKSVVPVYPQKLVLSDSHRNELPSRGLPTS